ncbi:glycosyltransferase [Acidithiobacillus thiooxidans]|uniref:glycosyltransferase n=1 Tax=Acidithiobacillus thiooxidans TaxID=930 RepID=UPI000690D175|nr:glycosyltransferase [Acidithiobacillus thiooxidans]
MQHYTRLAFVSPIPPEKTGIADYAAELLPELARHYEITVIVQQDVVGDHWVQANAPIRNGSWFRKNERNFDRVLYHFGNSPFHDHMFDLLAVIPGVVVLHDFYLSWPVWHRDEHGSDKDGWVRVLLQEHGWNTARARLAVTNRTDLVKVVNTYPCNLNVLQQALGVIVHSDFSRQLARQFYGDQAAEDWTIIPLLRQPPLQKNKVTARQNLGLSPNDFVVCSFGVLGPTKLNHHLLKAWLASPLATQSHCFLVFVGENDGGEYGQVLLKTIARSVAKDRILITGWTSNETYQDWLVAADMAVQLRTLSRGETSAAVLDCMNYGLPLIANAHGSIDELPVDVLCLLPDVFSDSQLTEAITALYHEQSGLNKLSTNAMAYIRTQHSPRFCADQYSEAIETAYSKAEQTIYGLSQQLPQISPSLSINEYLHFANALAANFPPAPRIRQLLLDVSAIVSSDLKSGIERVVRAILDRLVESPPEGWVVVPVYATNDQQGYRNARQFMCRFLDIRADWAEDSPVQVWQGDVFWGLDYHPYVVPAQESILNTWRNRGVRVYFVVYDLLPVLMAEAFPEGAKQGHHRWLQTITRMDGVLCISQSVADELYDWLQVFGDKRESPFSVYWFHLGADVDKSNPSFGLPIDAAQTLHSMTARPSFLMVGTIEPRKGYLQTLHAFDLLWAQGVDCNLVIVGKEGWKLVPGPQRYDIPKIVECLRTHPECGKHLFWLESSSDEYLEQIYTVSTCLIAASYGEGFGLPLIEAARHGLPLLVRDIPVFHEVTTGQAHFFADTRQPEVIAEAVIHWLAHYHKGQHLRSDTMPHLTWIQSVRNALDIVLGKSAPYVTWMPDGIRRYWGSDPRLHTEVGQTKGCSIKTSGIAGFLIYGPYERYEAGRYRIILKGEAERLTGNEILNLVCNHGEFRLSQVNLTACEPGQYHQEYDFNLDTTYDDLEFQIYVTEETDFIINELMIIDQKNEIPLILSA